MSQEAPTVPSEPKPTIVALTGPVTWKEAPHHRQVLLAALALGGDLRIDLSQAGPWDVAGLQLLLAAQISGRKSGLKVRLEGMPSVLQELAEHAGVSRLLEEG